MINDNFYFRGINELKIEFVSNYPSNFQYFFLFSHKENVIYNIILDKLKFQIFLKEIKIIKIKHFDLKHFNLLFYFYKIIR